MEKRSGPSSTLKIIAGAALLSVVVAAFLFFPIQEWFRRALDWVEGLGPVGPLAVVGLYVVASVLFVPGSILTIGSGVVFGLLVGSVTVSVGATLGAAAAFVTGRFLARDWVASKVAGSPRFAAIDRAVGEQGFKIVLLTRLSPVFPFNLLNYAYGLTGVGFWKYALASWLGMIPGTIMYVYVGSALGSLAAAQGRERTLGERVLFWAGLIVTVVVAVLVTRIARRALANASDLPADDDTVGGDAGSGAPPVEPTEEAGS